jgi:hypothetical protein
VKVLVICPLGRTLRGEGEDKGRIKEEEQGATEVEKTWEGD